MDNAFMIVIIALIINLILIGPTFLYADEHPSNLLNDIHLSFTQKNSNVEYIQSIKDGKLFIDKKTKFNIKANAEHITCLKERLVEKKVLPIQKKTFSCMESNCQKEWIFDFHGENIECMKMSHLQLFWEQAYRENTPDFDITIFLEDKKAVNDKHSGLGFQNKDKVWKDGTNIDSKYLKIKGTFNHLPKKVIPSRISPVDFRNVDYVEKSLLYVIKRELGFNENKKWRYSNDGKNLILQGRIDAPIRECKSLQLSYKEGGEPLQISLSIDKDGDKKRDMFILWDYIHKNRYSEFGRNIISLDFSQALEAAEVDLKNGYLLEVIIFMPMDFEQYKSEKPLEEIVFGFSKENTENILFPYVFKRDKEVFMDFDFGSFSGFDRHWNLKVRKVVIAANIQSPQYLRWKKISLVDKYFFPVNTIAKKPAIALQKWTDNFSIGSHEQVSSFRPLFKYIRKKSDFLKFSKIEKSTFSNRSFKDENINISLKDTWYRVKKNHSKVTLNGIFSEKNSWLRIVFDSLKLPVFVNMQKINLENIIVERIGDKYFNLPYSALVNENSSWNKYFSLKNKKSFLEHENEIYLPKGDTFSLLIKNEVNLFSQYFGGNNANSEKKKQWKLQLSFSDEKVFSPVQEPIVSRFVTIPFLADNPIVRNKLWLSYTGESPLSCDLNFFDKMGIEKKLPILLPAGEIGRFIDLEKGSRLSTLVTNHTIESEYELSLIDIKMEGLEKKLDFNELEWWETEDPVFLTSASDGIKFSDDNCKAFLYQDHSEQVQWAFKLDTSNIFGATALNIENSIPTGCKAKLLVNNDIVDIEPIHGRVIHEIDLVRFKPLKKLVFILEDFSKIKNYQINVPYISSIGSKHSANNYDEKIEIQIGKKTIPVRYSDLLKKESEWISLGAIELFEGSHFIDVVNVNSNLFRIKSLTLETNNIPSENTDDIEKKIETPSLLNNLIRICSNLLPITIILLFLVFLRKWFGLLIISFLIFLKTSFSKNYSKISNKSLSIFWFLGSSVLYVLSMYHSVGNENYASNFGSIFVVIGLWHFSQSIKQVVINKYTKLDLLYKSYSRMFFVWAIGLLVFIAFLTAFKLELFAEEVAVIVYYLLLVGILGEIINLRKEKQISIS